MADTFGLIGAVNRAGTSYLRTMGLQPQLASCRVRHDPDCGWSPILAEAVVDTGGVYLLCHPEIARRLSLTPAEALSGVQAILFRGVFVHGRLYRLGLTLFAEPGEDVTIQTTAFVPEPDEAEHWGDLPCILGLYGCLERARFAVDPRTERFYFGPAAESF